MKQKFIMLTIISVFFLGANGCASGGSTVSVDSKNMQKYPAGMVINGYILPPEPDPKLNNATLLGVDSNHNGIRDDVERFIIISESKHKYYPKIWTAIVLNTMKKINTYMVKPTSTNKTKIYNSQECYFYVLSELRPNSLKGWEATRWDKEHGSEYYNYHQGYKYRNLIFNTPKRKKIATQLENTPLDPRFAKKNKNACGQETLTILDHIKENK